MPRKDASALEHDEMVQAVARRLTNKGFQDIKVDAEGWARPDAIEGTVENHIPDATGTLNGQTYIIEVETADTIFTAHTESQWQLFSSRASNIDGVFVVVVPKEAKEDAQDQLWNLSIGNTLIWSI